MELDDEQLAAAARVFADALREYGEIHADRSRDYGRGFALARVLLQEWAEEIG